MAQSLAKVYLHSVFSTKYRQNLITPSIEPQLHAYIGGIIKNLGGAPIEINSMPDHMHILSTLPRTITIAKYLEEIKKNSSKWIKTKEPGFSQFSWQNGYATFSVGYSTLNIVARYIQNQKQHHKKKSFKKEVIQLLDKHEIEYNEAYLWD